MNELGIKKYHIKIMSIGSKIILDNINDYNKISDELKNLQQEYFSYTLDENKTTRYVLYGLPVLSENEIIEGLKECGLDPIKVQIIKPKNSINSSSGTYFVTFKKGAFTLNQLRAHKYVAHTVVKWDFVKSTSQKVTQCRRCLMFGHGEYNCQMQPKCKFCAQTHMQGVECAIKEKTEQYKCHNCGGNHLANSVICPKRSEYLMLKYKSTQSSSNAFQRSSPSYRFTEELFPSSSHNQHKESNQFFTPQQPLSFTVM